MMTDIIDGIADLPLDITTKGFPAVSGTIRLGDVAVRGWNVIRGDVGMPALTLRDSAFRNNLAVMRKFVEFHGLSIAPHGKTPMCPQLFRDCLEIGGAWGISAATVQQAAVMARWGVPNVILANEVVGRANVEKLAQLLRDHPEVGLHVFVDSEDVLEQLVRYGGHLLAEGRRFDILVEVGAAGARAGARTMAQVEGIVRAARGKSNTIRITGVGAYEGAINRGEREATLNAVDAYLDFAVEAFRRVHELGVFEGLEEAILTAGGSCFFDRVARRLAVPLPVPTRKVLRGGTYIAFGPGKYSKRLADIDAREGLDGPDGLLSASASFQFALEVWGVVQSAQDVGTAIVAMGKRDISYDDGLPVPLRQYRDGELVRDLSLLAEEFVVVKSDDQHAYLRHPATADVRVGDLVAFGPTHPCTAFDKWDVAYRVDDSYTVTEALKTFF